MKKVIKKIRNKIHYLNPFNKTGNIFMLLLGFMLISSHAYSQFETPTLPQVTTPSPKATMMNRYGDYPVSLYTGLVDITIPIFEININGVKVPIEFKYHASGLKYDDLPMELGYGWTLIAGGTISRSVRGTPEGRSFSGSGSKADPYVWIKEISQIQRFQQIGGSSVTDQDRLVYIQNGDRYPFYYNGSSYYGDSEYDEWSYNFLHHSGKSYRLDNAVITVPTNGLNVGYYTQTINVTDNEGISYTFTQMDLDRWGFNEVWYLTKIISANGADVVSFEYTTFPVSSLNSVNRPVIDQLYEVEEVYIPGTNYIETNTDTKGNSGLSYKSFYPPQLNAIKYRGGKVEFTYTNTPNTRNLSEIRIYDNKNALFRTVKLVKPRTDWLDGVEFRDNANVVQQTYSFEYNGVVPKGNIAGIDYWGYYNGSSVGGSYIPKVAINIPRNNGTYYSHTIPGTTRTPNDGFMQSGVLNKITYPTKGYTVFRYEAHKASNNIFGGLRIKEILNYNQDDALEFM